VTVTRDNPAQALTDADYEALLGFRDELRRFLHWSEQQAVAAGITPAQYQLLLAVRGHVGGAPSIGDIAEHLLLRHHSVVGLVDRAVAADLVERRVDAEDQRLVRLRATPRGAGLLRKLASLHLAELRRMMPVVTPHFVPETGWSRPPR